MSGRRGAAAAAVAEWESRAAAHPGVTIELEAGRGDAASLDVVWSTEERRAGNASRAMRDMLSVMDAHGVTPSGEACSLERGLDPPGPGEDASEHARIRALDPLRLDDRAPLAWYRRLGFEAVGDVDERRPSETVLERRPRRAGDGGREGEGALRPSPE